MDANVDYDRGIVKTIAITIKSFAVSLPLWAIIHASVIYTGLSYKIKTFQFQFGF
jgi:hypothetical protein